MSDHAETGNGPRSANWKGVAEWGFGAFGSAIALLAPLAILAAPHSDVVVVVGGPGDHATDIASVVAEADGAIVSMGWSDNVILARSDSRGFVTRLYAAGARLVLDADMAEGCGPAAARTASITTRTLQR